MRFSAAESLEERVEFQQCDTYTPGGPCIPTGDPGDPGTPPVTVTPEPATLLLAAAGLGSVGVAGYLRRRSAKRQSSEVVTTKNDASQQD